MDMPLTALPVERSTLAPTCRSLRENRSSPRWLSVPNSRLVVNPSEVTKPPVPDATAPTLSTNLAYYCGERPVRLPVFWGWEADAVVSELNWAPHELAVRAVVDCGRMEVETSTCLADEDTLVHLLTVPKAEHTKLVLTGRFPDGDVTWDETGRTLTLRHAVFHAVIAVSRPARFREGAPEESAAGVWRLEFDDVNAGDEIALAAGFKPSADGAEETVARVREAAGPQAFRKALRGREIRWDRMLADLPHPVDFTPRLLKRRGVDPEAIRNMYYKAWVFLLSDTLPLTLENRYPYPQVACGKPSLWDEGHRTAPPSCQWESFIAMQFLTEIDPDSVWSAYEGMMSLVDDLGTLGGEGLPSRHAQTAWVLYSATRDRARLAAIYPPLKRLLLWKASDPRWIYKDSTPVDSKDSEFVVHALLDMLYARRIAEVLQSPEEIEFWQAEIEKLRAKYEEWFWETPGGAAYRFYFSNSGDRTLPGHPWSLEGLALPPSVLGGPERESLLALLNSRVRHDVPFLIAELNKHPGHNYTMRGAYQYGTPELVQRMAEAGLSSVTLAGEFGECYSDQFPVRHHGVAPSVFGSAVMIDDALWLNGVMMGDGLPVVVRLPGSRGVRNLKLNGHAVDILFDHAGNGVEISGKGLHRFRLPAGFLSESRSDGTVVWRGELGVGDRILLEQLEEELQSSC